jgi:hypothetical protein
MAGAAPVRLDSGGSDLGGSVASALRTSTYGAVLSGEAWDSVNAGRSSVSELAMRPSLGVFDGCGNGALASSRCLLACSSVRCEASVLPLFGPAHFTDSFMLCNRGNSSVSMSA